MQTIIEPSIYLFRRPIKNEDNMPNPMFATSEVS